MAVASLTDVPSSSTTDTLLPSLSHIVPTKARPVDRQEDRWGKDADRHTASLPVTHRPYIGKACGQTGRQMGKGDRKIYKHSASQAVRQADRQATDRQAARQPERQSVRQADRRARDRQAARQPARQPARRVGRQAGRQPDIQAGRQADKEADRQAGRQTRGQTGRHGGECVLP